MVTTIISINIVICCLCLYTVKQLRKFTKIVRQFERDMTIIERQSSYLLKRTSRFCLLREKNTDHIKDKYDRLNWQLQQMQKFLALLNLGKMIYFRRRKNI